MIIYEVNLEVRPEIAEAFAAWLPGHIEDVLALPGFVEAEWLEVTDVADDGRFRCSVRYVLETEDDLGRYLTEFAPRMRGDGLARFGDRFTAERRVLRPLGAFRRQ